MKGIIAMQPYLTKSLFRTGVTCATKLFFTAQPELYVNRKTGDTFLQALAEGGMQVGELAKCMHPGGIEVTARGYDEQVAETSALLAREEVTLFEAAIRHGSLFARVDVLRKRGQSVDLIEVKAKSFDPKATDIFVQGNGEPRAGWLPYLQDIAFQCHVFTLAFPALEVRGKLMLVDKTKPATVKGLAARFGIRRERGRTSVVVAPRTDATAIGEPILAEADVTDIVRGIMADRLKVPGQEGAWHDTVQWLASVWTDRRRVPASIGAHCKGCEFRAPAGNGKRSGFDECWASPANAQAGLDLSAGTVLDLWNSRDARRLIDHGILRLVDTPQDSIGATGQSDPLTPGARRWLQVDAARNGTRKMVFHRERARNEMKRWAFPLHFIDFETARSPVPFFRGQHPNALVAFQFSHHVMSANGSVSHRSEFLDARPGRDPNATFCRALRDALGADGTVLMWSPYERTVLKELTRQIADEEDAEALNHVIGSLTEDGPRALYDLCKLAEQTFFHPATGGSSSIKKVLPAILESSQWLADRYRLPIYGAAGGIRSLNFANHIWFTRDSAGVVDPYRLLQPVVSGVTAEEIDAVDEAYIAEGGAAAAAYVRLQDTSLAAAERAATEAALRRYCELDSLAMVMIVEAWRDWSGIAAPAPATA